MPCSQRISSTRSCRVNGSRGFALILLTLLLALCFMFLMITGVVRKKNTLKDEVQTLIAKGVKPEDHGRALELLLRQSVTAPNEGDMLLVPRWFWIATAIAFAVACLLSFGARTAFEIGKGEASVRWQKWYGSFLRKTIPAFVVLGVLSSMFGSILLELLRSK
jgi:hypothetical protein